MKFSNKDIISNNISSQFFSQLTSTMILMGVMTICGIFIDNASASHTVDMKNSKDISLSLKNNAQKKFIETEEKTSYEHLTVDLDISNITKEQAYFSICNKFSSNNGQFILNYRACMMRQPIKNGIYQGQLPLSKLDKEFVSEIWIAHQKKPIQFYTHIDELVDGKWVIRSN